MVLNQVSAPVELCRVKSPVPLDRAELCRAIAYRADLEPLGAEPNVLSPMGFLAWPLSKHQAPVDLKDGLELRQELRLEAWRGKVGCGIELFHASSV